MKRVILLGILCVLAAACAPLPTQTAALTATAPKAVASSPALVPTPVQLPAASEPPVPSPMFTAIPPTVPPTPSPIFDLYIDNLAINSKFDFYAGGFSQGDDLHHFARLAYDGWHEIGRFSTGGSSLAVDSFGNLYTEILTNTQNCMAIMQWDGSAWNDITGNFPTAVDALRSMRVSCNIPVVALAVDGEDRLYASGSYYYPSADLTQELPMGYVALLDKGSWSVMGEGFDGANIHALATGAAGEVYAGGDQPNTSAGVSSMAGFIAHWDGKKWSHVDMRKLDSCVSVTHIAQDKGGGMYASCTLNGPGVIIAYWDGASWTTITNQLEGEAPAVFAMAVGKDGQLYIAGDFTSVSGVIAHSIAAWDTNAWHALGEGANERVQALAFDMHGELYAAGWFTKAGGVNVDHIARWDGAAWHKLLP